MLIVVERSGKWWGGWEEWGTKLWPSPTQVKSAAGRLRLSKRYSVVLKLDCLLLHGIICVAVDSSGSLSPLLRFFVVAFTFSFEILLNYWYCSGYFTAFLYRFNLLVSKLRQLMFFWFIFWRSALESWCVQVRQTKPIRTWPSITDNNSLYSRYHHWFNSFSLIMQYLYIS